MKATAAIILDERREKLKFDEKGEKIGSNGFPVKLRITFQRKSKLYGIGIDLLKEDWNKIHGSNLRDEELKKFKTEFSAILTRSEDIIKDLPVFSFEAFEKKYKSGTINQSCVYAAFDAYVEGLYKEGRIGSGDVYNGAKKAFKNYKAKLTFSEVTPDFLKAFEKWWLDADKSITTIGIYTRCLKAVFNVAIEEGIVKQESYPFGKRKYIVPSSKNIKKALDIQVIAKIFNYQTQEGTKEEMAKDFWIFTYLCNGINPKDICKLRWKDLRGDRIIFVREKSKKSTRVNPKSIIIVVPEDAKEIIEKWGTKDRQPNNYIFPFLTKAKNLREEQKIVAATNKAWNTGLKSIAKDLGINGPFTTYSARHSFSTVLKRSGASTEFIAEALGHSSTQITQAYLDSFEDSVKREYSNMLTSFKKAQTEERKPI